MRLFNRLAIAMPWLGLMLGFMVCSLPLLAMAADFKPPRRGLPGRREGGGTRDPIACIQGNPSQLVALLPGTNLGLTTAAYPRFFWFAPKSKAKFAEFSLYDVNEQREDRTPIYKTIFSIAGTAGIASLSLPSNATMPPLVVGKDYHWSVALVCNPDDRTRDIKVDGWVQRVAPEPRLTNQLVKATPEDRVRLYANNGIWFDTVTTLVEQRCAKPQEAALINSWAELLKSVQLDAIAEQPLMQQCRQ
ncbi:MAG: DUF928 domain-containing protein [Verrucomicrobia bacterium]|nr:DUF928 domain-containing protein [Leptolyngbya sp. ES-bin-22]